MRALLLAATLGSGCATTPSVRRSIEPFREGMTRPVYDVEALSEGVYTPAAREAGIEGQLVVRCVIMADGTVRDCQQLKPLPLLGAAMVSRLEAAHVTPATYKGQAVSVNYVFNFVFRLRSP